MIKKIQGSEKQKKPRRWSGWNPLTRFGYNLPPPPLERRGGSPETQLCPFLSRGPCFSNSLHWRKTEIPLKSIHLDSLKITSRGRKIQTRFPWSNQKVNKCSCHKLVKSGDNCNNFTERHRPGNQFESKGARPPFSLWMVGGYNKHVEGWLR